MSERGKIARALYAHEFASNRVEYPSYDDPRTTAKCRERFLARADAILSALRASPSAEGGAEARTTLSSNDAEKGKSSC
jgi:hypothetical protein